MLLRPSSCTRRSFKHLPPTSHPLLATSISTSKQLTTTHHHQQHRNASKLPTQPVRTRFAPSPTGYLHLGSLRTALFNYLLARKTNGHFLLRLEDTDAKRTVPGAEEALYRDLLWAGLPWDEGPSYKDIGGGSYGPYRQSERTEIYQKAADELLQGPHAYRCFCSQERLDELSKRRKELGLPTDYDRLCASLEEGESEERAAKGEKYVVRLRAPAAYPPFTDLIYGKIGRGGTGANAGIVHKHGEVAYEDPVLLKSDGRPTYHLANVVDDHEMQITHVVRATEWTSSTPKHLALYDAFGWKPPEYAHVGLLVDKEGRKLSKRAMDAGIDEMRDQGWLKEAVVNFAALLGCSFGGRGDVMELHDLVNAFEMRFTKGNAVVTEDKLRYLQRAHAERAILRGHESAERGVSKELFEERENNALIKIVEDVQEELARRDVQLSLPQDKRRDKNQIVRILRADPRNYVHAHFFVERNRYLFTKPSPVQAMEAITTLIDNPKGPLKEALVEILMCFDSQIANLSPQDPKDIDQLIHETAQDKLLDRQMGHIAGPELAEKGRYKLLCKLLRAVLLAGNQGPGIANVVEVLGPDETCSRIRTAAIDLKQVDSSDE